MYNNGFLGYQQKNGINWVQGIEGAKAFQLPPIPTLYFWTVKTMDYFISRYATTLECVR